MGFLWVFLFVLLLQFCGAIAARCSDVTGDRPFHEISLARRRYELAFFVADWTSLRRRCGSRELRPTGIADECRHGDSRHEKRGAFQRRA
jgi:hypothetical protein